MRVVAGHLRSRKIEAVEGMETRPTADRIKEAVFSRIGPYFQQGNCLDCYGGSGNIGIEAVSRGIEHVDVCGIMPKAVKTIQKNIRNLKIESQFQIYERPVEQVLDQLKKQYTLIYIDPPYALQQNVSLIQKISDLNLLEKEGVIVVESLKEDSFPEKIGQYILVKEACYGITKISYYEHEGE